MSDNQHMDLRKKIFLIGKTIDTINNKKIATNKEALQLLISSHKRFKTINRGQLSNCYIGN